MEWNELSLRAKSDFKILFVWTSLVCHWTHAESPWQIFEEEKNPVSLDAAVAFYCIGAPSQNKTG